MGARFWVTIIGLIWLGACTSDTGTPTSGVPTVLPKRLATVYISPTPDAAQQEATRLANPATELPPVTALPSPTAYIGVFLGEVESANDGGAVINPVLVNNAPTPFNNATVVPPCPAQADVIFGNRWQGDATASQALGCPIELGSSLNGSAQVFERGVMYARPGGEVWAIAPGEGRFWYYPVALPPPPGSSSAPPAGLFAPSPTFETVWRSVQGLSDIIGYGRTEEEPASITTQRFQGGALLADGSSGQVFILLADSRAFGPY